MNIYVLIEGERAIKKLYSKWICLANNSLSVIHDLRNLNENNFFIQFGYGLPKYWGMIDKAVQDVNNIDAFDRLVISVDTEDRNYDECLKKAKECVQKNGCRVEVKYVIQDFCIETWLLGNINAFRKKTRDPELVQYKYIYDVRVNDPVLLPENKSVSNTKSQFAYKYLRAGIRDVYNGRKSYSKKNPGVALENGYYNQVKKRCLDKNHIQSFNDFLAAFI